MSPQAWWYAARATGLVAWALVSASVIIGLLVSTRLTRGRPGPAWFLDLHRFVGGMAVVTTGLHLAFLVADNYVHFGLAEVTIPFASSWRPGAVALGIVALYVLATVEATSVLMRRLPRRAWRAVHMSSYIAFWLATFHLVLAGTDASHPITAWSANVVMAVVVFLTLVRILVGRPTRAPRREPQRQPSQRPDDRVVAHRS